MCPTGTAVGSTKTKNSSLQTAFEVLDTDHDGKISQNDLRNFYTSFSVHTSLDDDVIGSMIMMADSNKDGYVEYEEFEKVLGSKKDKRSGVMEDVFRVMDKDGDGMVGYEDLKNYFGLVGFEASDDDINAMIRLGGAGGGGDENEGVTYDGLLKILAV